MNNYVIKAMNKSEAAKHLGISEEQLMKRFYRGIDKPYKRNGELVWEFIVPERKRRARKVEEPEEVGDDEVEEAEELPEDENEG